MTSKIIFASNKLGIINDGQLQAMLDKFKLGKLISSEKTANGAMGQTIFVASTEGDFVFKGNPLYDGQLLEEKYFIENIHKRTKVSVPMPYIIDDSGEIFGWSYALMPRLPGEHLNSKYFTNNLSIDEKFIVAELIAKTLSEIHTWKVTDFGDLNTDNYTIEPFKESYKQWLFNRIMFWLEDPKKYSEITAKDIHCFTER
ncbi:phosphotransferase [Peribacillus frigoritolerans]|uniref:phosphotransferase n=1 Tax=Peribacillus frigoritolerans TaxID=450367 RepID=UPI002EBB3FB3|nr:phosphotransferase [Peribacillus frigoritolerans]